MGSDIHGWIEVGRDFDDDGDIEYWKSAVNLGSILGRSYGFFGSFFGVRNYANFDPVAANRGLPEHLSRTVERMFPEREATDDEYHSHTWLSYDEDIDWTAIPRVDQPDAYKLFEWERATRTYKFNGDGELLEQDVPLYYDGSPVLTDEQFERLKRKRAVKVGEYRYESYPITRYEAAGGSWQQLRRWFEYFREKHYFDRDELRLVVWFDN